jgi:hypothetical protein
MTSSRSFTFFLEIGERVDAVAHADFPVSDTSDRTFYSAAQCRIKDLAPNGTNQLPKVIGGVRFQDGMESSKCRQTTAPNRVVTQNPA